MSKLNGFILILSGFALLIYFYMFGQYEFSYEGLIFWGLLAIVSETFVIVLPNGASTSVGMAIYLATLITINPLVAILVSAIAFIFRLPTVDGKRKHVINMGLGITTYNIASHTIFIGMMGVTYNYLIHPNTSFNMITIIALVLLSLTELISIIFISLYFRFDESPRNIQLIKSFLGALPSTLAIGSLGILLAFAELNYGKVIVALFFIPLLLARYSFKLYFDSQKMSMETIQALNEALLMRDAYTSGHATRVERYAAILAKALKYSPNEMENLQKAAKLHDIGKIGIPDEILNKSGKLSEDEYTKIKDHSAMGAQILSNVDVLRKISEAVKYHHERPDGKGYPEGLIGETIPRDAAILSIADTFDAMTTDRPYRKALTLDEAVEELILYRGTQFNASLVGIVLEHVDEFRVILEESQEDLSDIYYNEPLSEVSV
ncbi:HD-GYP domain-containing protein [Petrocella sp. FN5]|uniref:HD-GYP domain-containing protein n=1 Tax=Petrocella sp. FN5 TaxID=3032002 RepID=UPI0023DC767C|nr:HD-GYP domain-containing protein [Petrocella sp. FN5]MDF1617104.1 HD-GYP domain-containing protein [Petrocella sp. FN5]